MTTVCVGCGLDVNDDGQLIVELAPGTPAQPNMLECGAEGLTARNKRKHLRRHFTALGDLATASDVGPILGRPMTEYTTVDNNGSAGTDPQWTIQGDGSILINIPGLYMVSQQTIIDGSTGQVVGGRARVVMGAGIGNILCSSEINDKNHVIDLAYPNDGPEFSASAVRYLPAATELTYISNAYLDTVGQGADWAGEFTLTYLGEFV